MELFNLHIQQGRDLCSKLSSVGSVIKTPPAQLQSQLAIEVVSPILANSQNPLSVVRSALASPLPTEQIMHLTSADECLRPCSARRPRNRCDRPSGEVETASAIGSVR